MATCLDKLPHNTENCSSASGLQVFSREDGTVDGYCFACKTFVRHPYGEEKQASSLPAPIAKTPEEIEEEIKEIKDLPTVDLPKRKLRAKYLEQFGIKVSLSEVDGVTPTVVHYPYRKDGVVVGYKNKLTDRKIIWSVGDTKGSDIFGWEEAKESGSNRIIITEGEDDAVAVKSILDRYTSNEYKDRTPAVVSLPRGVSTAGSELSKMKEKFVKHNFTEVYLCFDNDGPGDQGVQDAMLVMPEAKRIILPAKDANECILKGLGKKAHAAIMFNAKKPKNTRLVFGQDLHEEAKEQAKFGELTWPWNTLNETTRGVRYGETIYIGGGVKMGKSDVLNSIAAHFIKEHDVKVFMAKPEEANKKSYKLLAGKIVGKVFHDPKVEMDNKAFDEAGKVLEDRLAMVNLYQHMGWDSLKDDIVLAVHWGAKAVFIDPITNLTNGMNSADANVKLQEIAQDLAKMALDHNIVIFIFCHLKANEGSITKEKRSLYYRESKTIGLGSCPHELGGDISSSQFAGSRSMMRSCNMMIGLEGNKDEELDKEVRNVRHLRLLEDREFGETVTCKVYWNQNTTELKEIE